MCTCVCIHFYSNVLFVLKSTCVTSSFLPAAQFEAVWVGLEVGQSAELVAHSCCSALTASCLALNVRLELLDGPAV